MENNTQSKSRFFAQYFETDTTVLYKGVMPNACWGRLCLEDLSEVLLGDDKEFSLLLTPLRNISDEDAIEISRIAMDEGPNAFEGRVIASTFELGGSLLAGEILNYKVVEIADYLRSKSYALPYLGVTVEQQIQNGWVKLNEK